MNRYSLRISLVSITLFFVCSKIFSQSFPVGFEFYSEKKSEVLFEIHIKAKIESKWHIYAQDQPKEAIAVPTSIKFTKNPMFVLVGGIKEIGKKQLVEEENIRSFIYHSNVDFVQLIKLKAKVRTNAKGYIAIQACDDKQCLPPRKFPFDIPIISK